MLPAVPDDLADVALLAGALHGALQLEAERSACSQSRNFSSTRLSQDRVAARATLRATLLMPCWMNSVLSSSRL